MIVPEANYLNMVDYYAFRSSWNGLPVEERHFLDVQKSAVGWVRDKLGRVIYFKNEKIKEALIVQSPYSTQNEVLINSQALQRMEIPVRLNNIEVESKNIENDPHFPGFSFWLREDSTTNLESYGHYWGIHKSGLIIDGQSNSPLRFNENLWQQFCVLVVFDESGEVIRLYNDQNPDANIVLEELKKKSERSEFDIFDSLKKIEEEFIGDKSMFMSKFDLLKYLEMNHEDSDLEIKRLKDINRNFIYTGTEEALMLLTHKASTESHKVKGSVSL